MVDYDAKSTSNPPYYLCFGRYNITTNAKVRILKMIQLTAENFPQITSFFNNHIPNFPVVMKVIEGNNPEESGWIS